MGKAIEINNFRKSFGENIVIKDLSFAVNAGEVFAFLGANGSGKNHNHTRFAWNIKT